MTTSARSERKRAAFTLIELMAVVAIIALVSTLIAPNFSMLQTRRLTFAGQRLASLVELTRQRTVVTGIPHRMWFDLDAAAYRVERLTQPTASETAGVAFKEYDVRGSSPLPLSVQPDNVFEFEPLPGKFGRFESFENEIFIAGLETPEGWIADGESFISFAHDGSTAYTELVIEDASGRQLTLAVLPLDDAVRFIDEEAG